MIWIMGAVTTLALATAAGATVMKSPGKPAADVGATEAGRVEKVNQRVSYLDGQSSVTFRYPGAEYVKVHFASLLLLPGDYLVVGNGTEEHRVTRTGWAMSVTGDTARVELRRNNPLSDLVAQLGVVIDEVSRGLTKPEREAVAKRTRERKTSGREESICGNDDKFDAVCYRSTDPVLYRRSKAVARLLIKGTELCTAFRVGAQNRMMTNYHCIGNAEEASDTEVWFNYQCAECGGYDVFRPTKVWLSEVLASDSTLDFTLFSVTDFAVVQRFGFLELDVRRPDKGEELYIPQHPTGAPAMIALSSDRDRAGNCAVEDSAYDGYAADTDVSYYCDTEGGSSGSPVLSRNSNKVVALHHFGGCPNSGVRMERIFTQVQSLL